MASSDRTPTSGAKESGEGPTMPPGQGTTLGSQVMDKGAEVLQSLKPARQMRQHVCTFALYGHDLRRQVEVHHFATRLNQDFLQCAVYDSDQPTARLIGIEYIISDCLFESLPPDEQKLWHSHAYGIKLDLWMSPRVPEMVQNPELRSMVRTYGKFWCTWQVDREDRLPMGPPALMMSPQAADISSVRPELRKRRDERYGVSSEKAKESRVELEEPEWIHPNADYWKQHGKGFSVDVVETAMKVHAPFP